MDAIHARAPSHGQAARGRKESAPAAMRRETASPSEDTASRRQLASTSAREAKPTKNRWYAIVTTENSAASQPQRASRRALRSGGIRQPKSVHPATLGRAKTRKPSQP
jgi:hypothetical protein